MTRTLLHPALIGVESGEKQIETKLGGLELVVVIDETRSWS